MELKKVTLEYDLKDNLPLSYGHKLRGFFANEFDHVLFHNHKKDGSLRYQYPLIQYKIVDDNPVIVALKNGCEIVSKHFLDIDRLNLNGKIYKQPSGKLSVDNIKLEIKSDYEMFPYSYEFISPWMSLSQSNYSKYKEINEDKERRKFLSGILIGNILSFAKGIDWWVDDKIVVMPDLEEIIVNFKGNKMIAFTGKFYSNIFLPEYIGLGKSTSRGFGTIKRKIIE